MGCKQGKASPLAARSAGSEDAVKSPLLLGSEDASAKIKAVTDSTDIVPDIPISDEQETEPGSQQETFTAATSTEPESEMPVSPHPCDDIETAPVAEALQGAAGPSPATQSSSHREQADSKALWCLDPESSSPIIRCQEERTVYGAWSEATISGTTLIFHDTRETVALQLINSKEFRMMWKGENCKAVLRDDGKLHWSDGDVWSRAKPAPTTAASLAKENELRMETLKNAAIQNNRSFNFPGPGVTTAADVQKAGEAAAARANAERSGNNDSKAASEEKPARKERPVCCC